MKPITETLRTRNRTCRQVNVSLKITSKETLPESPPLRCSRGGGVLAHEAPAVTLCYLCKLKMAVRAPSTSTAGAPRLRRENHSSSEPREANKPPGAALLQPFFFSFLTLFLLLVLQVQPVRVVRRPSVQPWLGCGGEQFHPPQQFLVWSRFFNAARYISPQSQ